MICAGVACIELDARAEHKVVRAGAAEQDVAAAGRLDGVAGGVARNDRRSGRRLRGSAGTSLRLDLRAGSAARFGQPPLAVNQIDETSDRGHRPDWWCHQARSRVPTRAMTVVSRSRWPAAALVASVIQVGAGGIGGMGEFRIVIRCRIDEPAVAGGVDIDRDVSRQFIADGLAGRIPRR